MTAANRLNCTVFGAGMRGRPQVWPDIQMGVLREVNPDLPYHYALLAVIGKE